MNAVVLRRASRDTLGNVAALALVAAAIVALGALQTGPWWLGAPGSARWAMVCAALVLYLLLVAETRGRADAAAGSDDAVIDAPRISVFWASQTGFAHQLAERTADTLAQAGIATRLRDLAHADGAALAACDRALFVVSTTGEGDPPDQALTFVRDAMARDDIALPALRYGVLALGDREYAHYCGFGHRLDQWLRRAGATPLFDLIEVDNGDAGALRHWQHHLGVLANAPELPDWAPAAYERWTLRERREANPGSVGEAAFHLRLQPESGALPPWQAGDIAEIGPRNAPLAVEALLAELGLRADAPVQRDGIATTLGACLADSHLPAADAARGHDADALAQGLQRLPHREYSIASLPEDGAVELLVRRMRRADGSPGLGSGWLCDHAMPNAAVALRIRANRNFHAPDAARPLVLIGNGTGIAGLRAHLKARAAAGAHRNWLLFGERNADRDAFYRDELTSWRAAGDLQRVDLVFSRDAHAAVANGRADPARRYVQHALRDAADELVRWHADGAAIYVCGSLAGMAPEVDAVLREVLGDAEVEAMLVNGRYRRDVY
jgi:sulfite reductase (NADPH) flavoprotein alpha-component